MMIRFKLILLFLLAVNWIQVSAQVTKPDIQYVTLTDTFLIQTLDSLITHEEATDSLFSQGIGYFSVGIDYTIKNGVRLEGNARIDTVFTYGIGITYMHPEAKINRLDSMYPNYFSFVSDRLVVFGIPKYDTYFGFSEGSKEVYRRIVEQHIAPAGHPSLRVMRLDAVEIFYLKNRITGEYQKPAVDYIPYPRTKD